MKEMFIEPIISDTYKKSFIDDKSYSPSTHILMQGLAAVIEDETNNWRPTLSELLKLLPHDDRGKHLIKSGFAYVVGKKLRNELPAPSILMFCSALNYVGELPNTELRLSIEKAKEIIKDANLYDNETIKTLLRAAEERARFDMVSEMLRIEFRNGLIRAGGYSEDELADIVKRIVNIGHESRHEALIDIIEWSTVPVSDFIVMSVPSIPQRQEFWDALLMRVEEEHTFFGTGRLGATAAQAEKGCALALLTRLESLK